MPRQPTLYSQAWANQGLLGVTTGARNQEFDLKRPPNATYPPPSGSKRPRLVPIRVRIEGSVPSHRDFLRTPRTGFGLLWGFTFGHSRGTVCQ